MPNAENEKQGTNTKKKSSKKVNNSEPTFVVLPKECVSCGSSKSTSLGEFRDSVQMRGYDRIEFHRVRCDSCDRTFNQRRFYPIKEPKTNDGQKS